ncbi:MAG: hypothetical protein FD180_1672 [Planctomycetota bacterium]|nr:MAG: hypothetical protein FD180_1672 [Planctomycetota bacterium]
MRFRSTAGFVLLGALILGASHARAEEVDLADTCFRLGVIQEPELDVAKAKAALDAIVDKTKARLKDVTAPRDIVAGLNDVLLKNRKVSYISNKYWRDSTLVASLLRGQGNCLSTTTLFAVVGQRLGLPVHAVTVPGHAFARFDDGKTRINIETTNNGVELPDSYYDRMGPWVQDDANAVFHGRTLTPRQFAGHLHDYAGRHLDQAGRSKEALKESEASIRLWPENESLELGRLGILQKSGKREEALKGLEDLFERSSSPEVRARILISVAHDLQSRGEHEKALERLRTAFREAPKHLTSIVLSAMANSYRTLRRFDEALVSQELSLCSEFQPDADDFSGLAILYKNANKLDDAVRCLYMSLERNPESWNTRLILAGYLIRAGRDDEGWKMFKTVEKPPIDEEFFETNMAWFYASVSKKKEFLEHLDKALSLHETPHILNYIKTEVDFDKYRNDAEFKALVERHRKRLEK